MHWPVAFIPGEGTKLDEKTSIFDTWRVMENLVRANLTRYIGISNFAKKDVEAIMEMVCNVRSRKTTFSNLYLFGSCPGVVTPNMLQPLKILTPRNDY